MKLSVYFAATFTAELVQETVEFWMARLGYQVDIKFAPYNQVFQAFLDPQSLFARNTGGSNIALIRWQDLGAQDQIESNATAFINTLATAVVRMKTSVVVISCPGSPSFLENPVASKMASVLDGRLSSALECISNAYCYTPSQLTDLYPVADYYDPGGDRLGHIPYTPGFFTALGTTIARQLDSIRRKPTKAIVVDLDNTLWDGVVGEDGPDGVRLDRYRLEFQRFLLDQRADGMLLAITSKNNEEDAWEVFRRPDMILKQEHFASWRINWEAKSTNLNFIAGELSLGIDSFIFIDDDPKEIAEAEANLPQIHTLRMPDDTREIPSVLRHFWAFDRGKITEEDRKRSQSYQEERERSKFLRDTGSLQDFIVALDLRVVIEPVRPEKLPRVAQLTQRTNQFNTTTVRRNEADLQLLLDSGRLKCITIAAADRFGDYGNVGVALYCVDARRLEVESFMLSCRALGRGVEHQVVRHLGEIARGHGTADVEFRFVPSKKNAPALRFLESLSATREASATGELFRMSAADACALTSHPVFYGDSISQKETINREEKTAGFSIRYDDIATRFRTVDAILAEMRTARTTLSANTVLTKDRPRTETERCLTTIWAEVLRVSSVGIHDSFFDLGGDSLMAVELLLRIIETFKTDDLTLSAVIEAPTIAGFAKFIEQRAPKFRCLLPIRAAGSRPYFFCVPGAGGNVLSLRGLATNLPEDQPFWCLQAPGLDGSEILDDARQIADLYIREVQTLQRHGPYYIGGGSYGGVLAFEMAQQLRAHGEEVALLIFLDTYNLAYGRMISKPRVLFCHTRFFLKRVGRGIERIRKLPLKNWPGQARSASIAFVKHLGHLVSTFTSGPVNQRQAKPAGPTRGPHTDTTGLVDVLECVRDANMRAVEHYTPLKYGGAITVLKATTRLVEPYEDEYLGWGPVACGGIESEMVPGDHISFISLQGCADALDRHLRRAQALYSAAKLVTPALKPRLTRSTAESEHTPKQSSAD